MLRRHQLLAYSAGNADLTRLAFVARTARLSVEISEDQRSFTGSKTGLDDLQPSRPCTSSPPAEFKLAKLCRYLWPKPVLPRGEGWGEGDRLFVLHKQPTRRGGYFVLGPNLGH